MVQMPSHKDFLESDKSFSVAVPDLGEHILVMEVIYSNDLSSPSAGHSSSSCNGKKISAKSDEPAVKGSSCGL